MAACGANKGAGGRYFLSYKQAESKDLAMNMWYALGQNKGNGTAAKPGAWLDVKNPGGQDVEEMMKGVKNCDVFCLILTPGYFDSAYCSGELVQAINLGKKVRMCFNTDMMAKVQIGNQFGKASKLGINVEDWPSAIGICTDIGSFDNQLKNLQNSKAKVLKKKKNFSFNQKNEIQAEEKEDKYKSAKFVGGSFITATGKQCWAVNGTVNITKDGVATMYANINGVGHPGFAGNFKNKIGAGSWTKTLGTFWFDEWKFKITVQGAAAVPGGKSYVLQGWQGKGFSKEGSFKWKLTFSNWQKH